MSIQAGKSSKDVGTLMFSETVENNGTFYTVKHENYSKPSVNPAIRGSLMAYILFKSIWRMI